MKTAFLCGLIVAFAPFTPVWANGQEPEPRELRVVQSTYQGLTAREWAARAVRNRRWFNQADRDRDKRGRTIKRLKRELARGYVPWYWIAIGSCESGLRWSYNGSSGFDGALQFHPGTWSAYRLPGYPSRAYLASPFQQLVVAERVLAAQGWGAWPACSRKVGLR